MPNAKGKFSEQHASFIGTYWGHVSSPFCCEVVESADAVLALGPMFNGERRRPAAAAPGGAED